MKRILKDYTLLQNKVLVSDKVNYILFDIVHKGILRKRLGKINTVKVQTIEYLANSIKHQI